MKTDLRKIHRRIRRCKKCVDILGAKVLPRSGFPPDNSYKVVVVGAEPGSKAKGMMTPIDYRKHFMPGTKNTNRVRLLFEDLKSTGIDHSVFFYTNAVKCPANPNAGQSRKCFVNCKTHLEDQLKAIDPKILVVFGSAASLLIIKRAQKNTIERDKYLGIPAIVIRHPQGASIDYRLRVARRIKDNLTRMNITMPLEQTARR
jgi:uracil-DNA glycosylase family 4